MPQVTRWVPLETRKQQMLENFNDSELRSRCKQKLETLELWLRRLIDQVLGSTFGDYFNHTDAAGNRLIAKRISTLLDDRIQKEPQRYARKIDAVLLDDSISIICHPVRYQYFRPALEVAFPDGNAEARTFLKRLNDPRNRLAHANPISLHDAERIFCYSSDVIKSISTYYANNNMNQEYNVPLFIRATDSLGHSIHRDQMELMGGGGVEKDFTNASTSYLRPGDTLTIELEVDSTFDASSYKIDWNYRGDWNPKTKQSNPIHPGLRAVIEITPRQVSESFTVMCRLITDKDWHRLGEIDDCLILRYRVLPPI